MECKKEYLQNVLDDLFEDMEVKIYGGKKLYNNGEVVRWLEFAEEYVRLFLDQERQELIEVRLVSDKSYYRLPKMYISTIYQTLDKIYNDMIYDLKIDLDTYYDKKQIEDIVRNHIQCKRYYYYCYEYSQQRATLFNRTQNKCILSDRSLKNLGYTREDVKTLELEEVIHKEDLAMYYKVLRGKQDKLEGIIKVKLFDGTYQAKYFDIVRVRYLNNEVYIAFILEEELNDSTTRVYCLQGELEEERKKNEIFSTISHELKTPLNVILATATLIKKIWQEGWIEDIKGIKWLEKIETSSYKVLRIANNVIDLTKIDTGQYKLECRYYNIVELIENTYAYIISYLKQRGIELAQFIFDTEIEEKVIWCDPVVTERAVLTIISATLFNKSVTGYELNIYDRINEIDIATKVKGLKMSEEGLKFWQEEAFAEPYSTEYGEMLDMSIAKQILSLSAVKLKVKQMECGIEFLITVPVYKNRTQYVRYTDYESRLEQLCKIAYSDLIY